MCGPHYYRNLRHGDPLGGGNGRGEAMDYLLSEVMQYEGNECLTWPYLRSEAGYAIIAIDGSMRQVHRVVCEQINGPPPSDAHHAAHSCGKGHLACVTKRHQSWKTPAENQADRLIHGTDGRGEKNAAAKLAEDQVRQIRSLRGKQRAVDIADVFGLSVSAVYLIWARQRWGWLE